MVVESMDKERKKMEKSHKLMLGVFIVVLIWSAIKPYSFITWLPEALPAIVMVVGFGLTYNKYRLSNFAYFVIFIHIIIILIGSKYTYERNPLFNYLMERYNLNRNYYDRVGHFAQGFTPAIVAKEILLKEGYLKRSKIFYYILMSIVLAISAFYELIEFATSKITGIPGYIILSYQGDEWDTQWDMTMALIGGIIALALFRKIHDKSMKKLE